MAGAGANRNISNKEIVRYENYHQELNVPMPHALRKNQSLSPGKLDELEIALDILAEQQKEQLDQLKDLLKDVDNSFKNIVNPHCAQNSKPISHEEPSRKRTRKRRR